MAKNIHLKFLAIVLAAAFWLFVATIEHTVVTVPGNIVVEAFNQSEQLALRTPPGEVNITVRTSAKGRFSNFTASDFDAYVDLRDVGVGTHRLPVVAVPISKDVSVVRVEPAELSVRLEPMREKLVSLDHRIMGNPASGFSLIDVKKSRENITVVGAESLLPTIAKAIAVVELSGVERGEFVKEGNIEIVGKDGKLISGLVVREQVTLTVRIEQSEGEKVVGIVPTFEGNPRQGAVEKITVDPAIVSIRGKPDVIARIDHVQLESVNLNEKDASFSKFVSLIVPEGISLAPGSPVTALVRLEISEPSLPQ